ncbi:MAG TPA: hypothetical protein VEA37_12200 [Flavobacterium sp.]|nr:hypothetical protein [Flavobacterium sp.]
MKRADKINYDSLPSTPSITDYIHGKLKKLHDEILIEISKEFDDVSVSSNGDVLSKDICVGKLEITLQQNPDLAKNEFIISITFKPNEK